MHVTALRRAYLACGGGGGLTIDHVLPLNRSTSVRQHSDAVTSCNPTATHAVALTHDTPRRSPPIFGFGVATIDHAFPFQCSIKVLPAATLGDDSWPTAKQLAPLVHDTA